MTPIISGASLPPLLGLPLFMSVLFHEGGCSSHAVGDLEGGSLECEQFVCACFHSVDAQWPLKSVDLTVDRLANRCWKQ